MRRRLWIVALCSVVGLIIGNQIRSSSTPTYEAQAVLLIQPPTPALGQQNFVDFDRFMGTELSALKNLGLAERVATQLDGISTDAVDRAVRVVQRPKTEIVDLFATADSPETAQNLANTYADTYIADLEKAANGAKGTELKDVNDQLAQIDKDLQAINVTINQLVPAGSAFIPQTAIPSITKRDSLIKQQDKLLDTKTQLDLLSKLKVNTAIQQHAILPTHSKPTSRKLVLAGLMGGPMLGIGLALVTARFSSKVVDTKQIEGLLGQPIAGRIRRLRGLAGTRPDLIRSLPVAAEGPIDLLCVRAEANASPTSALRIAVIGTERGAASTTLAVAMAGRFARKGSSVVLVDADQNDPEISEAFLTGGDAGLPALLARVDRISEIKMTGVDRRRGTTHVGNRPVFTTIDPDLRVLGLGPKLGQTVLRRSNVPALLERLNNEAQVIVFDAGPLLDAATTVQLSLAVDAVVLAVPYRRQRVSSLEAVARQLQTREGELLPVITSPHRRRSLSLGKGAPRPTVTDVTDDQANEMPRSRTANGTADGATGQARPAANILDARESRGNRSANQRTGNDAPATVSTPEVVATTSNDD